MRKIQKLFILTAISTIMIFSPFSNVMANNNDDINKSIKVVSSLHLLEGEGNGLNKEYLDKKPTRFQVAIMTLKLLGRYEKALEYTSTDTFADYEDVTWLSGRNILAYLKEFEDLGWNGVGDNKFNPTGCITAKGYYKVLLELLGYSYNTDFKWETIFDVAKEKGLTKLSDIEEMKNSDLAIGIMEALTAETKENIPYIDTLVESGIINEELAIQTGLYTSNLTEDGEDATKVALEIKEIIMNNQNELELKFNTDIIVDLDNKYTANITKKDNKEILEPNDFKIYINKNELDNVHIVKILRKPDTEDSLYLYIDGFEKSKDNSATLKLEGSATSLKTKYGKIGIFKENGDVKEFEISTKTNDIPTITKVEQLNDSGLLVSFNKNIYTNRNATFETDNSGLNNQNSVLELSDYEPIESKDKLVEIVKKNIIIINVTDNRLIAEKDYIISESLDNNNQIYIEVDGGTFLKDKKYKIAVKKGIELYDISGVKKAKTSNTVNDKCPKSNITNAYEFQGTSLEPIKPIDSYLINGSKNYFHLQFDKYELLYSNKTLDEIKKGIKIARDGINFKPLARLDEIDFYNGYLFINLSKKIDNNKTVIKVASNIFYDMTGNSLKEFVTEPIDATGISIDNIEYSANENKVTLTFEKELELITGEGYSLVNAISCLFNEDLKILDATIDNNKFIFTLNKPLESSQQFILLSDFNKDEFVNDPVDFTVLPIDVPSKDDISKISFILDGDYIEGECKENLTVKNYKLLIQIYGDDRWFNIGTIDESGKFHSKEDAIDFSDWKDGTIYFKYLPNK